MRAVHLVNYNPANWEWPNYDQLVARTQAGGIVEEPWSVGQRRNGISPGDDVFLLRQGRGPRGLLGRGTVRSSPSRDRHWDGSDATAMFIDITWSELLPQDEPIEVDELEAAVPGFRWRQVYSSGRTVKPPSDLALLALWEARGTSAFTSSATYMEGLPVSSTTMRYERSRAARDRCIALHGHTCSICAFEFATTYGALGEGYVHVHHVVPLSARGQQDTVDPANDLVPVCANCHVMLHRSRSATDPSRIMTPAEMRAALPIPAAPR